MVLQMTAKCKSMHQCINYFIQSMHVNKRNSFNSQLKTYTCSFEKKEVTRTGCTTTSSTTSPCSSTDKGCSGSGPSGKGGILDRYVTQMQSTVMKGEKLARANELLVKAFTVNLLPPALMDSQEFRDFLDFISNGAYVTPHRTKTTELIDVQYENVLRKVFFGLLLFLFVLLSFVSCCLYAFAY